MTESARARNHKLGFHELLAFALGGVIGSGWLLGTHQAWQVAGRSAVFSWLIGGLVMLVIGLVLVQLGRVLAMDGGLVWWPFYSSGPAVATVVASGVWIFYSLNPPSEATAMVKVLGHWSPGLYDGTADQLSWNGVLLAAVFVVALIGASLVSIRVIARFTVVAAVVKVAVPLVVLLLLARSGFHRSPPADPQGVHHGFGGVLTAITSGGVIYAYIGFQAPLDFAGRAGDPRRDIPAAILIPIVFALVLYTTLQWLTVRTGIWYGVDYGSAYAQTAAGLSVNHMWITQLIRMDAVVSPAGAAVVYSTALATDVDELSRNRLVPRQAGSVRRFTLRGRRLDVPLVALGVNLAIGLIFLSLLRNWASLVSASSVMTVFVYAMPAVSYDALSLHAPDRVEGSGVRRGLAMLSFVLMTLILFWADLKVLALGVALGLAGTGLLYVLRSRDQAKWRDGAVPGLWLAAYFAGMIVLVAARAHGWLGTAELATLVAAVFGFGAYRGLVISSVAYMKVCPPRFEPLTR